MVRSVYDQILYQLTCPNCGHAESIVIDRLDGATEWPCEKCHRPIDLDPNHIGLKFNGCEMPRSGLTSVHAGGG